MSGRDAYDNALKNQKEVHNYESDTGVTVEKTAMDKIDDYRVDASIKRRMDKLQKEFAEE